MGTINYKTSEYITLGVKPYDFGETKDYILNNLSDWDLSDASEVTDDFVYDEITRQYEDDRGNAEAIVDSFDFDYFDVELASGYYEGFSLEIDPEFDFYVDEAKQEALNELKQLEKMLKELAGVGMVSCTPGWSTGYEDYSGTIKDIDNAVKEIKRDIENAELSESIHKRVYPIKEAASVYSVKLSQFLDGQDKDVQQFVKNALNAIFTGIKKDFDGYIEGKRPTIKNYGSYQTFSMMIQANKALKAADENGKNKWGFYYPVKDYCEHLGKIFNKKFDGNDYQCVVYNHKEDLGDVRSGSEYDDMTSPANYPMVGVYITGTRGMYKNVDKNVPGNSYSVIVSVPDILGEKYTNPFMRKNGDRYVFANDTHDSSDYKYTLTYDISDNEFVFRKIKEGDPDTFTVVYNKSGKNLNVFKKLVNSFDSTFTSADAEKFLADNGVKIKHSWWFNPYTD